MKITLELNKYFVLEYGKDCDGSYTSGRVAAFNNKKEAEEYLHDQVDGSDGMQYVLTSSLEVLDEYCEEYELSASYYVVDIID